MSYPIPTPRVITKSVTNVIQPDLFHPTTSVASSPHANEITAIPNPINVASGSNNPSSSSLSEKQELSRKPSSTPIVIVPNSNQPKPIQLIPISSMASVDGKSSNCIQQSDLTEIMHSRQEEGQGKSIAQADVENIKEVPKVHYKSFDATKDTKATKKDNNSIHHTVLSGKTVYPWHTLLPFFTTITNGKTQLTMPNLPHSLTSDENGASFGNQDNNNQKPNEGHAFAHNKNGGECKQDNRKCVSTKNSRGARDESNRNKTTEMIISLQKNQSKELAKIPLDDISNDDEGEDYVQRQAGGRARKRPNKKTNDATKSRKFV